MKNITAKHPNAPWVIITILAAFFILFPGLFDSKLALISPTDLGTDLLTKQWPNATFIVQAWKQTGEIPLWQPTAMGGIPTIGNPSTLLLYPLYWLIFALPVTQAFTLYFSLHLAWASLGVYWLGRKSLSLSPQGALLASITFAFSAKMLAHLGGGHLDIIAAVAWFPWLWGAINRLSTHPDRITIILAATAIAAQALTHLPTLLISSYIAGTWWLTLRLAKWRSETNQQRLKMVVAGAGILVLAFMLSAHHLLPMLEILPYSTRGSITFSESNQYALPVSLLIGLFIPTALAFPEWVVYLGSAVLLLIPASWMARKSFQGWDFLAILFFLGLLFAMGEATPLYAIMFRYFPGISWTRVPSRIIFFVQLSAALLAGAGWDAVRTARPTKLLIGWWIACGSIILLGAAYSLLSPGIFNVPVAQFFLTSGMIFLLITQHKVAANFHKAWILNLIWVLLLFSEIWLRLPQFIDWNDISFFTKPDPQIQFLAAQPGLSRSYSPNGIPSIQAISVSQSGSHKLEMINGTDPFQFSHFRIWADAAAGCDIQGYSVAVPVCAGNEVDPEAYLRARPNMKLLGLGNVRYVTSDFKLNGWPSSIWQQQETQVYENLEALPRAYVVPGILIEPDNSLALELLKTHDLSQIAVITKDAANEAAANNSPNDGTAEIVDMEPNLIKIQAKGPGWLVISSTWAPGWNADVDGIRQQVYRTNVAFMGLPLNEGQHTITLSYAPVGWRLGKLLSICGSLICAILIVWNQLPRKERLPA